MKFYKKLTRISSEKMRERERENNNSNNEEIQFSQSVCHNFF